MDIRCHWCMLKILYHDTNERGVNFWSYKLDLNRREMIYFGVGEGSDRVRGCPVQGAPEIKKKKKKSNAWTIGLTR